MTYARHLAHVTFFAAIAAAGFSTAGAAHAADKSIRIIELPRVTVVAKRLVPETLATFAKTDSTAATGTPRIIELPRVLVVAKRAVPSTTLVAERRLRTSGA